MKNQFKLMALGSDPEFIIVDQYGKGIPGSLLTSGTKDFPEYFKEEFALFKDNLTVEGNIPPCTSKKAFIEALRFLIDTINDRANHFTARIKYTGQYEFDSILLESEDGQEFGCSEVQYSWNAVYFKEFNDLSNPPDNTPNLGDSKLRTAGFHIHIGYGITNATFIKKEIYDVILAKLFDMFIVLPSLYVCHEEFRTMNYGLLGNYRSKPYGLECRALSSYFTNPIFHEWIWDQIEKMFKFANKLSEEQLLTLLLTHTYNSPTPSIIKTLLKNTFTEDISIIEESASLIKTLNYEFQTI